jgi:hypothetical protein
MRNLAQEFGISDVALAKTCRKARVPVPGRGYWARMAAGKRVRATSLPELRDSDRDTPRTVEFWPRQSPEPPAGPVTGQVAFESQPENRIEVPDVLRRPHPLVKITADALDRSTGNQHDGYLVNWQVRHLDVEVSKPMLKRALRIMDAVVKAFEARGWEISLGKDDHNSYVVIFGQRVPFGIREPRRQIQIPPAERRNYDPSFREEPSGRLALVLREYWGRSVKKTITETDKRPLENRLNDFMVATVALAHERAEWERRRAESEERHRREELARLEEQRRREAEAARVKRLEDEADRWRRSHAILEYVAAVRALAGATGAPPELTAWLEWAEAHARTLDPVQRKVRELTDTGVSSAS